MVGVALDVDELRQPLARRPPEQAALDDAAAEPAEVLAGEAFAAKTADKFRLQNAHYATLREKFALSAQMAVRVIGKVCDVYKRDKTRRPTFDPHGAVPYDQRILTFKALDRVKPSAEEVAGNPRSRSAIMRVAERTEVPA